MKILLAIDGSECSDKAVRHAAAMGWPAGSTVKILSVTELPAVPTYGWALPDDVYSKLLQSAREQSQQVVSKAKQAFCAQESRLLQVTTEVLEGLPKTVILDEAERWEADLIVLGSHGHRGWQRFLLGSVSQAVASHAQCSVEIVR